MIQNNQSSKHNVFISFHHKDEFYKTDFETNYSEHFISKSVDNGDIDPENKDEYIKRLIQEEHLTSSSIIVALYGAETKDRMHVDWEISAGISGKVGGHSGLIVLILPGFPVNPFDQFGNYKQELLFPYLHPRTAANIKSGYADVYFWPGMYPGLSVVQVPDVLSKAFNKRVSHKNLIDQSDPQYKRNR